MTCRMKFLRICVIGGEISSVTVLFKFILEIYSFDDIFFYENAIKGKSIRK